MTWQEFESSLVLLGMTHMQFRSMMNVGADSLEQWRAVDLIPPRIGDYVAFRCRAERMIMRLPKLLEESGNSVF